MISSQPVVVQVSSDNQYIAVTVPSDNANGRVRSHDQQHVMGHSSNHFLPLPTATSCLLLLPDPAVAQPTVPSEEAEDAAHTTYEDYNSVYSNGSNSAGQMYVQAYAECCVG